MGYTHYFRTHKDGIPVAAWEKICADVTTLLANLPAGLKIVHEYDEPGTLPEITDSLIMFNGNGDEGHETFYFERIPKPQSWEDPTEGTVFAFCKTACKPYDLAVCGVLIVIRYHAQEYVSVSSDGDRTDWMDASKWVKSVLGDDYDIPESIRTAQDN